MRHPAPFTQADVIRAVRAAKKAGAAEVEVPTASGQKIIIRLSSTDPEQALERKREVVL